MRHKEIKKPYTIPQIYTYGIRTNTLLANSLGSDLGGTGTGGGTGEGGVIGGDSKDTDWEDDDHDGGSPIW